MNLFGFGQSANIDILLLGSESRKSIEVRNENGSKEKFYIYYDGESIAGQVIVTIKKGNNKLDHQGIKIEFIGQITLYFDRGNQHEFISMARELASPGVLTQNISFPFEFVQVEKPFETYTGSNVTLRYFVRVTISRRISDIIKEQDIVVQTLSQYAELPHSLKMEVGIEDCLHIEFEYNKSKYHLKDVIIGKIYFLLVRIKVKYMEIQIIKRESTGHGGSAYHENDIVTKFEIMDGAPVRGECIPIRLFLTGHDLTPTMKDINKKFSVRYFLNLVLVDEEERRYFKEQEIIVYRRSELKRPPIAQPVINNLIHQVHLKDLLPQCAKESDIQNSNEERPSRKYEEMEKESHSKKEIVEKPANEQ